MDTYGIERIIRALRKHDTPRSPHREHDPRAGRGQGRKELVKGLAKIFSSPGDGATVFPKGKAPPARGVQILAAGDRANGASFGVVYSSHGLWTNNAGKQFVEPSFYVHTDPSGSVSDVVKQAEKLRQMNKQESVGVVIRSDPSRPGFPKGFQRAQLYRIFGPQGIVELLDPGDKKLMATKQLMGGKGVQIAMSPVGVRWLGGEMEKMVTTLDKLVGDLEGGFDTMGIIRKLEGDLLWEREMRAMCKAYDRDGEVVVECDGAEG